MFLITRVGFSRCQHANNCKTDTKPDTSSSHALVIGAVLGGVVVVVILVLIAVLVVRSRRRKLQQASGERSVLLGSLIKF
mgnify:CR=1 FL=1